MWQISYSFPYIKFHGSRKQKTWLKLYSFIKCLLLRRELYNVQKKWPVEIQMPWDPWGKQDNFYGPVLSKMQPLSTAKCSLIFSLVFLLFMMPPLSLQPHLLFHSIGIFAEIMYKAGDWSAEPAKWWICRANEDITCPKEEFWGRITVLSIIENRCSL